jgi:hypothetical protein
VTLKYTAAPLAYEPSAFDVTGRRQKKEYFIRKNHLMIEKKYKWSFTKPTAVQVLKYIEVTRGKVNSLQLHTICNQTKC